MLDDLAVGDSPHLYVVDRDDPSGRRDPERFAYVTNSAATAVHDEITFGDEHALEPLGEVEGREEPTLTRAGVSEIALPRVRPVLIVEALLDHVHVPALGRGPVLQESPDDVLRRLRVSIHAKTLGGSTFDEPGPLTLPAVGGRCRASISLAVEGSGGGGYSSMVG